MLQLYNYSRECSNPREGLPERSYDKCHSQDIVTSQQKFTPTASASAGPYQAENSQLHLQFLQTPQRHAIILSS